MAAFGRKTARQRMRRATQQALSVPTFRTAMDCTPWVLGGLWPRELHQVTAQTAVLAEYLKRDLQRIADSANERLASIAKAGLDGQVRQAEEARIINVARAFAVLRVESTVRQLRKEPLGFQPELLGLTADQSGAADAGLHHRDHTGRESADPAEPPSPRPVQPEEREQPAYTAESAAPTTAETEPDVEPAQPTEAPQPDEASDGRESESDRLRRLVRFVARQEPGLRWAAGLRQDGVTLLVTDLAHGWIPPGVDLPDGVELLAPQRRSGSASALLGVTDSVVTYAPGDSFGTADGRDRIVPSARPRDLGGIAGLAEQLCDATRERTGLPRLTHALVSTAAAGGRVIDAEVDVLRVHLDTARYQLLARYPDTDDPLLLNCLLLAATEALVTGDPVAANYHFGWFAVLSGSATDIWGTES